MVRSTDLLNKENVTEIYSRLLYSTVEFASEFVVFRITWKYKSFRIIHPYRAIAVVPAKFANTQTMNQLES